MGRRALMMAKKNKEKIDAHYLFNREENRQRKVKLPFYDKHFSQLIKNRNGIDMSYIERRRFEVLKLDNELEILLVQDTDPKATHAACAMAVDVGYFSDPDEMPGLAHLLEHMMFLGGNDRFESGELSKFVSSLGGTHNAYTVAEETNYHFDVPFSMEIFEAAIDRFTSSFVNPTFDGEDIRKESQVVDNEYAKNIGDPMRSTLELLRGNANPLHPFVKFSCGNYQTLHQNPHDKGLNIPDYLTTFFRTHYSANRMKAVLVAPCSLDKMKDLAKKMFSRIENFKSTTPSFTGSPYTPKENFTRFDMITHEDSNELLLSFPISNLKMEKFHDQLPHTFICEALSSKAPGSLVDYLEEKGWADSVQAFPMSCANECVLFWVNINCTEEGIWDHVEDINHAFFIFTSKLYHTGLPDKFLNDVAEKVCKSHAQAVDKYGYRFAQTIVHNMLIAKEKQFITQGKVPYLYEHDTFLCFLENIKPENMTLVVSHKGAEAVADMQEQYYKARYTVAKIDEKLLERFNTKDSMNEVHFDIPKKADIEAQVTNNRPFAFYKPKCCTNVNKLTNLPKRLNEKNKILQGKAKFFVYINKPKDEELDSGAVAKEEPKPLPVKKEKEDVDLSILKDLNREVDVVTLPVNPHRFFTRAVKDCNKDGDDDDDEGVGTIQKNKDKKEKGFLARGVISQGVPKGNKKKALTSGKVNGLKDPKDDTNNVVSKEKFAFASKDVGKVVELDATQFFKPPLSDMFRPPLLIKASDKSLLFFKQNVPTSMENFTTQVCVDVFIYPLFLADFKATPKDQALFTFYIFFVNNALARYKRKMYFDHNIKISIGALSNGISISLSGYDQKVFDICRQLLDEMKRTSVFKWERFDRFKQDILSGVKDLRRSPRSVCSTHLKFFTNEPQWLYTDMNEAVKHIKLQDVKSYSERVFEASTMQVLVVGNATPDRATKMFDLLENSLKSADENVLRFGKFPEIKKVLVDEGMEAFFVEKSKDIFKDSKYEFKTYYEDNNSAIHCALQVDAVDEKQRAVLALLGTLIDSPCNERIRTQERVGYLIHSMSKTGGVTCSLEFMFQSNSFGPFEMDEKLDRFLNDFLEDLKKFTKGQLLKAKNGIAAPALKPAGHISEEADYWSSFLSSGSYDFDGVHRFINALWTVTLEEVVEFYEQFILPGAKQRRKLLVGVTCSPHEVQDDIVKAEKLKQDGVLWIDDPYDFKYDRDLVLRKPL